MNINDLKGYEDYFNVIEEEEIKYRVYYKANYKYINYAGYWCSDAFDNIVEARNYLENKKKEEGFIEGHIKQEITIKIIVE